MIGGDLDPEILNEMSCCVDNGVVSHKYPRVKYRGARYHTRYCERCGKTKNLFKTRRGCIVCVSGDDSQLGMKCSRLKHCKKGEGKTLNINGAFLSKGGFGGGSVSEAVSENIVTMDVKNRDVTSMEVNTNVSVEVGETGEVGLNLGKRGV